MVAFLALFLRTSITNNILVVEMEELEKVKVEE